MSTPTTEDIAAELVAARKEGRGLPGFPGVVPASMAEAYRIQDQAISQWPDSLIGWKIGFIPPDRREAGAGPSRQPYFRSSVRSYTDAPRAPVQKLAPGAFEHDLIFGHRFCTRLGKHQRSWSPPTLPRLPLRFRGGHRWSELVRVLPGEVPFVLDCSCPSTNESSARPYHDVILRHEFMVIALAGALSEPRTDLACFDPHRFLLGHPDGKPSRRAPQNGFQVGSGVNFR